MSDPAERSTNRVVITVGQVLVLVGVLLIAVQAGRSLNSLTPTSKRDDLPDVMSLERGDELTRGANPRTVRQSLCTQPIVRSATDRTVTATRIPCCVWCRHRVTSRAATGGFQKQMRRFSA